MRFRSWGALGAFAVLAALLVAIPAAGALGRGDGGLDRTGGSKTADAAGQYIVRLAEAPVVAYEGGVAGYKATAPSKKGEKIDPNSPDVVKYASYLDSRHDAVIGKVGGQKFYDYRYSLNGFAAKLTAAQAAALKGDPDVISVEKDLVGHIETATTPAFLGLTAAGGLWEQLGGKGKAGEDVIIGVVDTGIWPEHPSFSDRTGSNSNGVDGKLSYQQIPGWHGKCTPGEDFTASNCNQKLIGAQYFNAGFGVDGIADRDFLSPRDYNGHGSHTSSTAGGNADVAATGAASLFGTVSGMAPRARIATYKVCWEDAGDGGCANSDSVAAIDQAVADGVDVINFSISGTRTSYLDAVEVSFLFAARAGVFVAASAGNSGPTATTVAHISPWLTSVAAGTHNRSGTATVTLGSGAVYTGASLTDAVGPAPLVLSSASGLAGAPAGDVVLCVPGTLDPAKVTGKIVVCNRGVIARVDKSLAVGLAGGVGMVLANVAPSSLNADLHSVPTVHVNEIDGAAIKAYAAGAGATASLSKAVVNNAAAAPDIAAFSSRGPSLAGGGDVLKPDIMAPGVDVLAAVAPPGNNGKLFDLLSGTSMSSPHMAGLAALLRQAHPDWSPMAIKSAFMTTATPAITAGGRSPFASGAGQANPNGAVDPGLVYDAGFNDWRNFLKGQGLCNFCFGATPATAVDASNLNQASIAVGDLAGSQAITRTVKSVGSVSETYTASVDLPGFTSSLSTSSFTIAPGGTQSYTLSLTRTTAALNAYTFGFLTWTGDKGHVVKSRLAIRPVALAAPLAVSGTGASGSVTYPVTFGYTGTFGTSVRGLVAAQTFPGTVVDDPTSNFNTANPTGNQGITVHDVVVPAGTTYARFSLFDTHVDGADDLDLYIYRVNADSTLTLVGSSGSGTSAEEVNLTNPAATTYKAFVHGWETDGPDSNYTFFAWTLGSTAAGNLTATPSTTTATTGASASVALAWSGLDATQKYLGAVDYSGSAGMPTTIVRIG